MYVFMYDSGSSTVPCIVTFIIVMPSIYSNFPTNPANVFFFFTTFHLLSWITFACYILKWSHYYLSRTKIIAKKSFLAFSKYMMGKQIWYRLHWFNQLSMQCTSSRFFLQLVYFVSTTFCKYVSDDRYHNWSQQVRNIFRATLNAIIEILNHICHFHFMCLICHSSMPSHTTVTQQ